MGRRASDCHQRRCRGAACTREVSCCPSTREVDRADARARSNAIRNTVCNSMCFVIAVRRITTPPLGSCEAKAATVRRLWINPIGGSPMRYFLSRQLASNRDGSGKRLQLWERQAALDAYRNARSWKRSQLSSTARVLRCRSWRSELACRGPATLQHRSCKLAFLQMD
jgi:hypothetical protein